MEDLDEGVGVGWGHPGAKTDASPGRGWQRSRRAETSVWSGLGAAGTRRGLRQGLRSSLEGKAAPTLCEGRGLCVCASESLCQHCLYIF